MAKTNGEEMTEESAKAYFELLHPKTGEIADEELDNVSGGNCYNSGRLVVTTRSSDVTVRPPTDEEREASTASRMVWSLSAS